MNQIPPYRQSLETVMGCEHGYKLTQIDGVRFPDTPEGERGTDLHNLHSEYAQWCAKRQVPVDLAKLDELCKAAGDEVFSIMESCRDDLTIDYQNFFASEISLGVDEDFRPTWSLDHDGEVIPIDPIWGIEGSGKPPAFCGILDVIYLMPGGLAARIPDLKSHAKTFDPDTDQSKLYPLLLMLHLPELQEVEFSLRFLRYGNLVKPIKRYRQDIPDLIAHVSRRRERQKLIHLKVEQGLPLRTHGGASCTYCPCTLNPDVYPCPLSPLNPNLDRTPAQWLSTKLAAQKVLAVADSTLKQTVNGTGEPVRSQDANGKWYEFGSKLKQQTLALLFEEDDQGGVCTPILGELIEWFKNNPQDLIPRKGSKPWPCNLRIGWTQLRSHLSNAKGEPVKKRALIHQRVMDLVKIVPSIGYGVTVDAELSDDPTLEGDGKPEEMEF